ncbi:hypothetical protein [Acuticoccus kandeliae]|uniref:hypothetical protein n=1 Tax=Acuticoccus kandeliae TaxID=2073160 RepID=UPI000D3EB550|nr:hypothetical protein [Acuticoccus kandeliae]
MKAHQCVMIMGLGELGGLVAELLARSPTFRGRIVGVDVDADHGMRKMNSVLQGALCWGHTPDVVFRHGNLAEIDATAALIGQEKPDLIFNATTLASWWLRDLLPESVKAQLHAVGAGSGIWAPGHAALAYRLMKAVKASGITVAVINSAYPDGTNPALARAGLAPLAGIGNGDLLIAPLRHLAAKALSVSMARVDVHVVAHHFHAYNVLMHGNSRGLDFVVRIGLDGTDVTDMLDIPALLAKVPDTARIPGASGATWVVAASAMSTMTAWLNGSGEVVHVPGPDGMVGGYPVVLWPEPTLALPQGVTREAAIAVNVAAQKAEGIERFEDDGAMVLTDVAKDTLKTLFDFEIDRYPLEDSLEIARDLSARLRVLGQKHGIAMKVH